jgi:Coenzyme F390 synthetase
LNAEIKEILKKNEFYKDFYAVKGADFVALESLEDLRKLPVVTKDVIRRAGRKALNFGVSNPIRVKTTGTTGTPLEIYCSEEDRQLNYAFFDEFLLSNNIDPKKKHVVIGGRILQKPEARGPYWRHSFFQNSLLMSSYHLSDTNILAYIKKIIEYAPHYIESYPSSIYVLAKKMIEQRITFKLDGVVTSAETLSTEHRETIEAAFDCKIFDQYGCAEMSVFGAQCSKGKYHVRPDYAVVEILDDQWNPLPDGDLGNIVCTSLVNRTMPFLRYAMGDLGVMSPDDCDCGLNTPILTEVQGRKDDIVYTKSGIPVGRLSPVLKGFNILMAQYIQQELGELELKIVPAEGFIAAEIPKIIDEVCKRVGKDTCVDVNIVKEIPKGAGGKFKAVISKVVLKD